MLFPFVNVSRRIYCEQADWSFLMLPLRMRTGFARQCVLMNSNTRYQASCTENCTEQIALLHHVQNPCSDVRSKKSRENGNAPQTPTIQFLSEGTGIDWGPTLWVMWTRNWWTVLRECTELFNTWPQQCSRDRTSCWNPATIDLSKRKIWMTGLKQQIVFLRKALFHCLRQAKIQFWCSWSTKTSSWRTVKKGTVEASP